MTEAENIIGPMAERIFADLADPRNIAAGKDERWKADLWNVLEENGFPLSWVPDALGGAGLSLAEGFEILEAAGRAALAVPLAETMLAGWLLSQGAIPSPPGMMTIAPVRPDDYVTIDTDGILRGRASKVPFARDVDYIALLATDPTGTFIIQVRTADCQIIAGKNVAGEGRDLVIFDGVRPQAMAAAPEGFNQRTLILTGCVVRSVQTAGALQAALKCTIQYAGERVAFGKPIGKFQAVQINVARLAGEVAAATAASASAADTFANLNSLDDGAFLEATSAKIRSAEAAGTASAIAHQVHGAIGLTIEYVLHRFTLRALSWSDDFGAEAYWAVQLGKRIAELGADALWPLVASR